MRAVLAFVLLLVALAVPAQSDTSSVPFSENGWYLGPHGIIRVLVIFAEIEYDKDPGKDPQPDGADHWPKGQLPKWKDDLFDPQQLPEPKAMVSRYYHDVSLGRFQVLGDHLDRLVTIRQSAFKSITDLSGCAWKAADQQNEGLRTAHGLTIEDFDLWHDGGRPGLPKRPGPDTPHSYDHVMVILRNSSLLHGQGSTDAGSSGTLFGFGSDTQSRFGAMFSLPFEILKHEFNHLLLGGNNFHSGGGNAAQFDSYTLCMQGGWSLMGAANSSLLTASAWDRDRLGWYPPDAPHRINARTVSGTPVDGDLDPLAGDTGLFVLRDLVTTGDALRIRMPFIPAGEYRQWLWLENHTTFARNGSPTDRYHWESSGKACVEAAVPGVYMQMQVEREEKRGKDIFGGYADYLHPLTACGHFDLEVTGDTLKDTCPFKGTAKAYRRVRANPLTGNCEQELAVYDRNNDGRLERGENLVQVTLPGDASASPRFFGRADHAFTAAGHRVLTMGSNPSSASMLTLTAGGKRERNNGQAPDNRTVRLNGIRVEVMEQRSDGSVLVRVSTGDTRLTEDVLWSADSIVLPPLKGADGRSLTLAKGRRLRIDRSLTPTRMALQEEVKGQRYFAPATRFTIAPGASVLLEPASELSLATGSELHVMPGASLELAGSAKLVADATSRIVLHGDARLEARPKAIRKLRKKQRLLQVP